MNPSTTIPPVTRKGDWFQTYLGIQFHPTDPRPEDVNINDIAHHLSLICRFGGAVKQFYSVGQHSLFVADLLPKPLKLQGLMHDATEAYIGDMIRPLKLSMPEFRACEDRVWRAICERFNLDPTLDLGVKDADNIALLTERRDLLLPTGYQWSLLAKYQPAKRTIHPLPAPVVEDYFLKYFHALGGVS